MSRADDYLMNNVIGQLEEDMPEAKELTQQLIEDGILEEPQAFSVIDLPRVKVERKKDINYDGLLNGSLGNAIGGNIGKLGKDGGPQINGLVNMHVGKTVATGSTLKPANLVVNIRELLGGAVSVGSNAVAFSETDSIMRRIILVISILRTIYGISKKELPSLQAACILDLASAGNDKMSVDIEEARKRVEKAATENEIYKGLAEKYDEVLDSLVELRVIEIEDGEIFLKEKVHVNYAGI